jgi:2-polyprenyl-6-methoxyphenol hydroxylase-like FAD-dependent oxidoreductase
MENILIVGASISGLCSALALQDKGYNVTVIERDDKPVLDMHGISSSDWQHRGVGHAMQPHFFLSELRNQLVSNYPGLVEELRSAGVREISVADCLHPSIKPEKRAEHPEDEALTFFASRRKTLDLAMQRYVAKQPGITLQYSTRVTRLILKAGEPPTVTGIEVRSAGEVSQVPADIVIDASGRSSKLLVPELEQGARISEELYDSRSAYYTRHYRLLGNSDTPALIGLPSVMFDDLVALTFIADNNHFVISLVVSQDDPLLFSRSMQKPQCFEEIVARIPKVGRWTAEGVSEPVSPVFGWANMDFLWRSLIHEGKPQVLGYLPVGDTVIRGTPKFGRGCTWAALGGRMVADAISSEGTRSNQLLRYENALHQRFRADWETMLNVDKADHQRFLSTLKPGRKTARGWLLSRITHWTSNIAVSVDPNFYREVVRGFYGLTSPIAWVKKPSNWLRVLYANIASSDAKNLSKRYCERPTREEIRRILQ